MQQFDLSRRIPPHNTIARKEALAIERSIDAGVLERIHTVDRMWKDGVPLSLLTKLQDYYHVKPIASTLVIDYSYGLLYSEDYWRAYDAECVIPSPHLPFVEKYNDFLSISAAGGKLALLLRNYKDAPASGDVTVRYADYDPHECSVAEDGVKYSAVRDEEPGVRAEVSKPLSRYHVRRMGFGWKDVVGSDGKRVQVEDKSVIVYNSEIRIENIPEAAYDLKVNGKSVIECLMELFAVTTTPKGEIMDIPQEVTIIKDNPRYILDLLLSVIKVSCQTTDIVNGLPPIDNCTLFNIAKDNVKPDGDKMIEGKERVVVNEIHVHGDATFSSNRDIKIGKVITNIIQKLKK